MPFHVVFVCSGNTCRSPMAAAVMTHQAASHPDLDPQDIVVSSAGLQASAGQPAARAALRVLEEEGLRPLDHRSAQFGPEHAAADLILTMTNQHKSFILAAYPDAASKVFTLNEYAGLGPDDIVDPYMQDDAAYRRAFVEIQRAIEGAAAKVIGRIQEKAD